MRGLRRCLLLSAMHLTALERDRKINCMVTAGPTEYRPVPKRPMPPPLITAATNAGVVASVMGAEMIGLLKSSSRSANIHTHQHLKRRTEQLRKLC